MQFLVTIVNKIFEELDIPESTKYGTVRDRFPVKSGPSQKYFAE